MTSRKNAVRSYETEIEKCREDSNWKKAIELANQMKARSPQHESLAHFLIGEGKLEAFLEECPPCKENIERAQRELCDARGYLALATDESGKRAGVALDAHLLLGKLHYACGSYEDALKHYKNAELDTLTEKELSVRSLRIVAESYAIKGICLELTTVPGPSRYKQAEWEAELIRSFEVASDLILVYLQRVGSGSGAAASGVTGGVAAALETALQRAPLLHIRAGRLHKALDRYREMLMAEESPATQGLRLTLTRQLAEVLLRGITGQVYKPPDKSILPGGSLPRPGTESPWKPKKYSRINQFVPCNELEEVSLVLLVGEASAARAAVLSQSAEFEAARAHALTAAVALADLLALFAARWTQLPLLLESLDRAMKFSFGCAHVWRQRALATTARAELAATHGGESEHAVTAVSAARRAAELSPRDAALRLAAAQLCYNTDWVEEGLEFAEAALAIEEEKNGPLLARCCLFMGMGYQMKAKKCNSRVDKERLNECALKLLVRAAGHDAADHRALYHLALQYAAQGMLNEAMDACRSCLWLHGECGGALRVAGALWASACAGRRRARALHAAALAARAHPHSAPALIAYAQLQLHADALEGALATGKQLLQLVRAQEEDAPDALSDSIRDDATSVRDAASVRTECTSAGVSERCRPPRAQRAAAWLLLAEICLRLDRVSSASDCVAEAAAITPYSHLVFYTRGLVAAAGGEWEEARRSFQDALAVLPTHTPAMLQLGISYYMLGWLRLSERWLRLAAGGGGGEGAAWRWLSRVLAALGEPAAAADAAAAALHLHHAAPHHHLLHM